MHKIFAGVHIQNKQEFLPLNNIDFEKDVLHLRTEIAKNLAYDAAKLELVYKGNVLEDDADKLASILRDGATVHVFAKTSKYQPYVPNVNAKTGAAAQELFNVTAHIQINVSSRMNILNKILYEYPEFRRNLGAQALIRDSVLFNTLHQPEVIKNITEHYPIIVEAAPFIVDTIKKELTRSSLSNTYSEPATDSTNSSEEENSLGASGSSNSNTNEPSSQQSENAQMRQLIQQQLQAALAQFTVGGGGSHNSLTNIAQRNADNNAASSAPLSTSASGERISTEMFRTELQSVLNALQQRGINVDNPNANAAASTSTTPTATATRVGSTGVSETAHQQMDTSEANVNTNESDGDIPVIYHNHVYAPQLRTMAQMGFLNFEENMVYLNITNGNIENAVNLLIGAMNQMIDSTNNFN